MNPYIEAIAAREGKTPEEIEAIRQMWLEGLGSIPEWEKFINEQFDSLIK